MIGVKKLSTVWGSRSHDPLCPLDPPLMTSAYILISLTQSLFSDDSKGKYWSILSPRVLREPDIRDVISLLHFLEQAETSQINRLKYPVSSYSRFQNIDFCVVKIQVCLLNLECFHFDPRSNVHISMFLRKSFSFNETMCSHQFEYFLFYK